jgi:hypothetical protein
MTDYEVKAWHLPRELEALLNRMDEEGWTPQDIQPPSEEHSMAGYVVFAKTEGVVTRIDEEVFAGIIDEDISDG